MSVLYFCALITTLNLYNEPMNRMAPPALAAGVAALIVGYFGVVAWIGANIQMPELEQAGVGFVILLIGGCYMATGPSYEQFSALCLGLVGIFAILSGGILSLAPIAGILMPNFSVTTMWATLILVISVLVSAVALARLYRHAGAIPSTEPGFWNTLFGVIGQCWLAGYLLATALALLAVALLA